MNTNATPANVRRDLVRGLAASLLLARLALPLTAQTEPAAIADSTKDSTPASGPVVILEDFTVTGSFMGSLVAAAEGKQSSAKITEIIAAEDIGKLPDSSIAEAIARLPGLAAQRVGGRAQVISMRGLAPDFATTLLNGREQVSTGDNRAVEFDQYPSELIGSVAVYKTPDASLVGQGLSGTLDLQTVKPFSYANRTVALNARYEMNSLGSLGSNSKDTGYRMSATYIDQLANRTVGVAFGYAHLNSPIASAEYGTYGWNTNSRPGVPDGTYATDGLKVFARSGTNTRDGFVGIVEWRPNETFTSTVDAYYSKFTHEETNRGQETHIGGYNGGNDPGLNYTTATIVNNTLVGGVASGVYPLVRNIYNKRVDKLTAVGWRNEYRPGDWVVAGDISYSKAERKELNLETQAQFRTAHNVALLDTVTYDLAGGFPTISTLANYADPAHIQVGPTIYGAGYGKVPMVKDELTSYKLSAVRKLTKVFENVEFGVNYADRTKNKEQPEASLSSGNWKPIASGLLLADTKLDFANGPRTLSWSVPDILATSYDPFLPSSTAFGYLIQKTWRVDEKIATYYAQLNLDSRLGSAVKLRGNIGLQLKDVDQSSTSNFFDNAAPAGQQVKVNRDGKKYTNVLPSANLVFDFENQFVLRLAAAKQVARPRLDQLKSAFEFNIDSTTHLPSGSGGNPRLDPWKATAADISLEKYFANHAGYVSVSGFYKKLDTYIFDQTDPNYDFSRFTTGSPIPVLTNIGRFSQPLNGTGGSLKGLEFTLSLPFQLVSKTLEGFGMIASAAVNSSSITVDNTNLGSTITLPGLSKTVTNLTLYYERKGFSTRISRRYRSDFIGEITGFGADRELRYVKGEAVIDAQIGYEFKAGELKGLGFYIQAYNITDSKYQTYQKEKERVVEYQRYGRTILTGVSYKF